MEGSAVDHFSEPCAGGRREDDEVLRIAIVASPRSGNTWLRGLLASVFQLEERAALTPEDVDWANLPRRVVLQIHWHPLESFASLLRMHNFRVVTPARHPLDVFISTLNYQQYVDEPVKWSNDDGRGERSLRGASPRSDVFLDYTRSLMAEHILATSREWWQMDETIRVRYEDLVLDTASTLGRVVEALGVAVRKPIEQVVACYEIDRLRIEYDVWHYHYWQGKPGQWKRLLPASEAFQIAQYHSRTFEAMGFACDPDPELDATQADLNWFRLQFESMRQHLDSERNKHGRTRKVLEGERARVALVEETLAEAKAHSATALGALADLRRRYRRVRRLLDATCRELKMAQTRLQEIDGLGPLSIGVAHRVSRLSQRHPWMSATIKRFIPGTRRSA